MRTANHIIIEAPWRKVFDAAARVERWPALLAHYRWVKVLSGWNRSKRRTVDMAAWRDGFPCRWVSEQVLHPRTRKVYFLHIRSFWTQGMEVWWIFRPKGPRRTEVILTHDMDDPTFPPHRWFLQHIVGNLFVHNIAGKTMAGLKRHLEAK